MVFFPGDVEYYTGGPEAQQSPDTAAPTRSGLRMVGDLGIKAVEPIAEAVRGVTSTARMVSSDPRGLAATADRIVAGAQQGLEDLKSPRQKIVEGETLIPTGPDDKSAWGDFGSYAASTAASFLPWIVGGLGKGAIKIGTTLAMGAAGAGSYNRELRDKIDRMTPDELAKDPNVGKLWNEELQKAGGDELVAKEAMYQKGLNAYAMAANVGANLLGGSVATRAIPNVIGKGVVGRVAERAAEGTIAGGGMGAASQFGQEQADIQRRNLPGMSPEAAQRITSRAGKTAGEMGLTMAPLGVFGGRRGAIDTTGEGKGDPGTGKGAQDTGQSGQGRDIDVAAQEAVGKEQPATLGDASAGRPAGVDPWGQPLGGPEHQFPPDTRAPPGQPLQPEAPLPPEHQFPPDRRPPPGGGFRPDEPLPPEAPFPPAGRSGSGERPFAPDARDHDFMDYESLADAESAAAARRQAMGYGQYDREQTVGVNQRQAAGFADLARRRAEERQRDASRDPLDEYAAALQQEQDRAGGVAPPVTTGPSAGAPAPGAPTEMVHPRAAAAAAPTEMVRPAARVAPEVTTTVTPEAAAAPTEMVHPKAAKAKAAAKKEAPAAPPAPAAAPAEAAAPAGEMVHPKAAKVKKVAKERVAAPAAAPAAVAEPVAQVPAQIVKAEAPKAAEVKETAQKRAGKQVPVHEATEMRRLTEQEVEEQRLRNEEQARKKALPPVSKGWSKLINTFGIEEADLKAKPKNFDTEAAREGRRKADLPLDWETFQKEGRIALDRGEENLEGTTRSSKQAKQEREGKQKAHREEIVQDVLETVNSKDKDYDKRLRDAVAAGSASERKLQERDPNQMRKLAKGEIVEDPTGLTHEQTVEMARDFQKHAQNQIAEADRQMKAAAIEARQRGVHDEGARHAVYKVPKIRLDEGTARSGSKEHPWYSRLADIVTFEHKLSDLLGRWDAGERDITETIQTRQANARTGKETGAMQSRSTKSNIAMQIRRLMHAHALDQHQDVELSRETKDVLNKAREERQRGTGIETDKEQAAMEKARADRGEESSNAEELIARRAREAAEDEAADRQGYDEVSDKGLVGLGVRRRTGADLRSEMLDHFTDQWNDERRKGDPPSVRYEKFREAMKTEDPGLYDMLPELGSLQTPKRPEHEAEVEERARASRERQADKERAAKIEAGRGPGVYIDMLGSRLRDMGIITDAERKRQGNDAGGFARLVSDKLNKELGNALRDFAAEVKRARERILDQADRTGSYEERQRLNDQAREMAKDADDIERMAREADVARYGRPEAVINRIIDDLAERPNFNLYREGPAITKLSDWFTRRVSADDIISEIARFGKERGEASAGPGTRAQRGPAVAPDVLGTGIRGERMSREEKPVTTTVTRGEKTPRDLSESTAKHVADIVQDGDISQLPPDMARQSTVRQSVRANTDRHDTLDNHLAEMANKIVPDTPVIHLHSDVFDQVMERVKPGFEGNGYYDWKSDKIYIREPKARVEAEPVADVRDLSGMTDAEKAAYGQEVRRRTDALMSKGRGEARAEIEKRQQQGIYKHEVVHAITMDALERDGPARQRLENMMETIRSKKNMWSRGMDSEQVRDVERSLNDVHEFVSELWSNDTFRRVLAGVPITPAERARWATPQARTVLQAFVEKVRQVVRRAFKAHSDDNALNEALINTADLFQSVAEQGRQAYAGQERTGAPGFIDRWMGDAGIPGVKAAQYWWRRRPEELALAARRLGVRTDQIPAMMPHDSRDLAERVVREIARTNQMINELGRADADFLTKTSDIMSRPQADEIANYVMNISKHRADPRAPLDEKDAKGNLTGLNKHISASPLWEATRSNHEGYMAQYKRLARIDGFADWFDHAVKLGREEGRKVARAEAKQAIERAEPLVRNDDGTINQIAARALVKHVMREHDYTPAEESWINQHHNVKEGDAASVVRADNFDKMVTRYRQLPGMSFLNGPFFPHKRHGDQAVVGHYDLADPTKHGGRFVSDAETRPEDLDTMEFPTAEGMKAYLQEHANGLNTAVRSYRRIVYDKATGEEAMRDAQEHTLEGGKPGTDELIITSREGFQRRITAAEYAAQMKKPMEERDPAFQRDLEVRHRVRLNNKYFETFQSHREASDRIRELASTEGLNLRPEPEEVRDFSTMKAPDWLDKELGDLISDFKKSPEYRGMNQYERKAVINRMMANAAHLIMRAGGRVGGMPREFVEGASRDLLENYMEWSAQKARALAYAERGTAMADAVGALDKHTIARQRSEGNRARRMGTDELMERAYRVEDPIVHGFWGTAANRILQMTYTAKLAGTSFLGINALEPALIGYPLLAGQYGAVRAFNAMRRNYKALSASKIFGAGWNDMVKAAQEARKRGGSTRDWSNFETTIQENLMNNARNARERAEAVEKSALIRHLAELGMFDPESVNQISLLKQPKETRLGRWLSNADQIFRGANSAVEVLNRAVLALSAYDLHKAGGEKMEGTQLDYGRVRAAEQAIYKGAGVYSRWNSPPVFNHPLAAAATQFKKYPQRIISNYIAAAIGTARYFRPPEGATAEMKAEYKQQAGQFAMMLTMQSITAGVFGLPNELFAVPVNAMYVAGLIDDNFEDMKNHAYKEFAQWSRSPDLTQIVAHGVLDYVTGSDISTRIGHDNLVFNKSVESRKPKDLMTSAATVAFGAPGDQLLRYGSGIQNSAQALQAVVGGQWDKAKQHGEQAARDFMPIKQAANLWDAWRLSTGDSTTRTRGGAALGPELQGLDIVRQGLGFTPTTVSRAREQRAVEKREFTKLTESRKDMLDAYSQASPENRAQAKNAVKDWNATHPRSERISDADLVQAVSRRRQQERRPASEMGLTLDKRTRPLHAEYERLYATE